MLIFRAMAKLVCILVSICSRHFSKPAQYAQWRSHWYAHRHPLCEQGTSTNSDISLRWEMTILDDTSLPSFISLAVYMGPYTFHLQCSA